MIRKRRYVPIVGALVAIVGIVGLMVFVTLTRKQGNEAVSRLLAEIPPETKVMLAPALKAAPLNRTAPEAVAAETPAPTGGADASDSVARYKALFERAKGVETMEAWQRRFDDRPPAEWTEDEWKQVEAAVDAIQDLVRDTREAAELGGPAAHLDYSKGMATELAHLGSLRQLGRVLSLDAWVQAHRKRHDVVVADVLGMMKLSNSLIDEPVLICQLVRIAIKSMAYDVVKNVCPPGSLSPELAAQLTAYAAQGYERECFTKGLAGEAAFGMDYFARMWAGTPMDQLAGMSGQQGATLRTDSLEGMLDSLFQNPDIILFRTYSSGMAAPWRAMDEKAFADCFVALLEASRLPYYEAQPRLDSLERRIEGLPMTRLLTRALLPGLARAPGAQARIETMLDLMRIGLTLDQYLARTGSYPASLSAIAPDLGGMTPNDPFTGKAYCYSIVEGGYRLYGVGNNLKDDGGKDDLKNGDVVWRGGVKKEEAVQEKGKADGR